MVSGGDVSVSVCVRVWGAKMKYNQLVYGYMRPLQWCLLLKGCHAARGSVEKHDVSSSVCLVQDR